MKSKAIHPVEVLREYATALEAAMTVALANPRKPAVHALRALVRRLESQMELLTQLDALSADQEKTEELHRQLGKLRRAAGRVRDLDVQRKMLKVHPSLPRRASSMLRGELKEVRQQKAKKLQDVLKKQLPRVAGLIEQLVQSAGTANGLVLPELRLIPLVERWTKSHKEALPIEQLNDEQLNNVRKSTKSARYMVENAADSKKARRAAAHYQELQQTGGYWHDWVDLRNTAREHFGKKHQLTRAAAKYCKAARTKYVKLLSESQ
jgi:CHAD domain-containing protein